VRVATLQQKCANKGQKAMPVRRFRRNHAEVSSLPVAIIAIKKAVTDTKKPRASYIINHVVTLPKWRNHGIATRLLEHVVFRPNIFGVHILGADQSKESKNQPVVALAIDKKGAATAAARRLFKRSKIKGRQERKFFKLNHSHGHLRKDPIDVDTENGTKEYLEASLSSRHWSTNADASVKEWELEPYIRAKEQFRETSRFVNIGAQTVLYDIESFVSEHRVFMKEMHAFHNKDNDGDGKDPEDILRGSDALLVAYNALPKGLTISTAHDAYSRQYRQEMREYYRALGEYE
jgi:GNAT superfamily N-acetyltransferase